MYVFKKRLLIMLISCIIVALIILFFYFVIYLSGKMTIECSNRKRLSKLMGVDFDNIEITDILCQYDAEDDSTGIWIVINETRPLVECEYYNRECEKARIPYGHVEDLAKVGIQIEDIAQLGLVFKEIRVGDSISPYTTYWYRIRDAEDRNVVFLTWIPRKISLNVEKILVDKS